MVRLWRRDAGDLRADFRMVISNHPDHRRDVESFGVPAPGQTIMVAAAIYAGVGRLNVFGVAAVAFVAAVLGDNIGYLIGVRGGRALGKRTQCVEIAGGEARHLEGSRAGEVGDAGEARRGAAVGDGGVECCGHHCL